MMRYIKYIHLRIMQYTSIYKIVCEYIQIFFYTYNKNIMSFINKLNNNLPGFLLNIPNRLQGNMLKPKRIISGIDDVVPILKSTINSVSITSAYNNITITMNITDPQYGWQSYLINMIL
jgi:hypothetical protein